MDPEEAGGPGDARLLGGGRAWQWEGWRRGGERFLPPLPGLPLGFASTNLCWLFLFLFFFFPPFSLSDDLGRDLPRTANGREVAAA